MVGFQPGCPRAKYRLACCAQTLLRGEPTAALSLWLYLEQAPSVTKPA